MRVRVCVRESASEQANKIVKEFPIFFSYNFLFSSRQRLRSVRLVVHNVVVVYNVKGRQNFFQCGYTRCGDVANFTPKPVSFRRQWHV